MVYRTCVHPNLRSSYSRGVVVQECDQVSYERRCWVACCAELLDRVRFRTLALLDFATSGFIVHIDNVFGRAT